MVAWPVAGGADGADVGASGTLDAVGGEPGSASTGALVGLLASPGSAGTPGVAVWLKAGLVVRAVVGVLAVRLAGGSADSTGSTDSSEPPASPGTGPSGGVSSGPACMWASLTSSNASSVESVGALAGACALVRVRRGVVWRLLVSAISRLSLRVVSGQGCHPVHFSNESRQADEAARERCGSGHWRAATGGRFKVNTFGKTVSARITRSFSLH